MQRRTRIVATLGPATDRPGVLEQLLQRGLDVARINFSHGAAQEHRERIGQLRTLARAVGRTVGVLADLPGPKLRALLPGPRELRAGEEVNIAIRTAGAGDLELTEPEALARVKVGQRVLFDDGRLQAKVRATSPERVTIVIEVGGALLPNKGVNLPDTDLAIPSVTARDREALAVAAAVGVDWLALSFVRDATAADELRAAARTCGLDVPILAKIERPEAVARADSIIKAFDGIMVARGDLGVEIPLAQVPHVQKRLIAQARAAGKPVVTATDMLDSMRHNPRPTRAEASDVANAVYDGTDAAMLSGETAVGEYPVEALTCMEQILREAECHQEEDGPRHVSVPRGDLSDHITDMTVNLARDVNARAIITPTVTGRTARLIARHRPLTEMIAPSRHDAVHRQLTLVWGVQPAPLPQLKKGDDRLEAAVRSAFAQQLVQLGDLVVILAGHPIEGGERFPTVRLVRSAKAAGRWTPSASSRLKSRIGNFGKISDAAWHKEVCHAEVVCCSTDEARTS